MPPGIPKWGLILDSNNCHNPQQSTVSLTKRLHIRYRLDVHRCPKRQSPHFLSTPLLEEGTQAWPSAGTGGNDQVGNGRAVTQSQAAQAPLPNSFFPQTGMKTQPVPGSAPRATSDRAWTPTFWKAHGLRRQLNTCVTCLDLELIGLCSSPSFVAYTLCDLKQGTHLSVPHFSYP